MYLNIFLIGGFFFLVERVYLVWFNVRGRGVKKWR